MPRRTEADPVATQIGARIRALREELGLTQEKLAYEAGLKSKGHLSGIEKGLVIPTLPTLALIAERLSVELVDLVTFPDSSDRHALVDLTRGMKAGTVRRLVREARG
jgi:transcriptional regulator with XRE-family HTH domain